ncbi:MAG TPA: ABC transporter permease [Spirochaetia bacterium]|nr:ABC transporter permease [Spirochaetia bacterium]
MARRVTSSSIIGPVIATAVVTLIVGLTTDRFFMMGNLRNLALQVSIVSLVGIGSTLVIIAGGIDLSPGSAIALLTMILASMLKFMHIPLIVAVALTVLIGAGLGLWNGVLTAYLRIPAFITTVASLSIFRGLAFMFNLGSPIFSISDTLTKVFYNTFLGIPYVLIYVIIFFALAAFVMNYTEMGRRMYAVGGNANAARFSGVNTKGVVMLSFIVAGMMAGFGSILMAARLNSGSPNYGVGMELSAIAAAVIGGASLQGGKGNVISTLFGALTITIVQNGLNLHAVETSVQGVVIGLIIMLAVFIDMWRVEMWSAVSRLARVLARQRPAERGRR